MEKKKKKKVFSLLNKCLSSDFRMKTEIKSALIHAAFLLSQKPVTWGVLSKIIHSFLGIWCKFSFKITLFCSLGFKYGFRNKHDPRLNSKPQSWHNIGVSSEVEILSSYAESVLSRWVLRLLGSTKCLSSRDPVDNLWSVTCCSLTAEVHIMLFLRAKSSLFIWWWKEAWKCETEGSLATQSWRVLLEGLQWNQEWKVIFLGSKERR